MKRRVARQWSSPFLLSGRGRILLLTALLVVVGGPGAAASTIRTRSQSVPTAGADPVAALAAQLEYDPQKIFRYVADEIAYEPYAGILRGAAGTLASRAGNSVDKALLLGTLLGDSQVSYRFARGALDAATAAKIVDSLPTDAATAKQLAQAPLKDGADAISTSASASPSPASAGPLAALYVQRAKVIQADAAKRLDAAKSRLGDTVTMLSNALTSAGVTLPSGNEVALPASETSDHTWVEMANGANWVDLDPTLAATDAGATLTKPSQTLTQLPDDLRYKVEFDVLVEQDSAGQLVTGNALSYSGFADQLAGTPISFGHVTPSGLKTLGIAISSFLGGGWLDYRPTLEVGGQSLIATSSVAFPLGPGSDLFGSEPSPGASPGPVDGEATAEWLQVQVTPPGGQPEVASRTVFDRLPAELRATGQLTPSAIAPVDLVDVRGTGSTDFPPLVGRRTFVIATGPTSIAPVVAANDDPLGMSALAYDNARDSMDAAMALDAGARTFMDGPNIVSVSVDVGGNGEVSTDRIGLDIWFRDHGLLPLSGATASDAQSQLVAGVTDQIAERFAVEGLSAVPGAPTRTTGVGEVFDAAASQGIATLVIHGSAPDSMPYSPAASALIKAAVAAGNVVVVPQKPVMLDGAQRVGWWSINPTTGETTDTMDNGAGQDVTEEAVLINGERQAYRCFGAMAVWASVAIMAAAELVSTLSESAIFRLFNKGFGGTQCFGA
jgi:hypothetical protein